MASFRSRSATATGITGNLNALEYHRCSEVDVAATELVLLLGRQQDVTEEFTYDTAKVEAFRVPAGTAVELYATTLHYAPCHTQKKADSSALLFCPRERTLIWKKTIRAVRTVI